MKIKTEQLYMRDIHRYSPLPKEEETRLLKRVKKGDQEALGEMILANLRFVVSVARKYRGRGLSLMELVNEGNMGLFKAAKKFEIGKDVKFISYAVWWIRQSIQHALFNQVCSVKIPPSKLVLVNKFRRAMEANQGDFNKTIEMPEFTDLSRDIADVLGKIYSVSLDTPIGRRDDSSGSDTLEDVLGKAADQDKKSERGELSNAIDNALSKISQREEIILRMYYGINYAREFTLDEIGKELKLTRERVRQIKTKALRKLMRNPILKDKLYPFVEGGS